jgi:hypothetical protein
MIKASIDLPGIRNVWSLKLSLEDTFDKYLVQSFTSETRILGIDGEEMSEVNRNNVYFYFYYSCHCFEHVHFTG